MTPVHLVVDVFWEPDSTGPGPRDPENSLFAPTIILDKRLEVAKVPAPGGGVELVSTSGERFKLEISSVYSDVSVTMLGSVFVERTKTAYLARIRSLVERYGFDPNLLSKGEYFW